ncbi:MAG: DUF4276 family protein [Pseudomonadota bacterium]
MKKVIYLEGGGDSKELHTRCREGFRKLLEKCGYEGKMPRLVACGGRGAAFADFQSAHESRAPEDFIAMMIDSEKPLDDPEAAWSHLINRDDWEKPPGAADEQVLFMTTCMETWIIADRDSLSSHYGSGLQVSKLPPLADIEERNRHDIQNSLFHATRNCKNAYQKGKRSFDVLSKLKPDALKPHLPSFRRNLEILDENLKGIERPVT